ncbi:MAG: TpiA [Candidatus Krumholzibacteriota bacterium]|nr:TpiA [Candidatus Krumholzibacteriota bacterium]
MSRRKLIAANWKMQMSIGAATAFAGTLRSRLAGAPPCDLAVFPPFVALPATAAALKGAPVAVGAQDLFWEKTGAYTGEISGEMVKEAGGTHVIVGHSERRHVIGESDEIVAKKLAAALAAGLSVVLCVGEKIDEREAGQAETVVVRQLAAALAGLSPSDTDRIVVAYEPVWAIGTGKTATPSDAVAMHAVIRRDVSGRFGAETAQRLRILYGGSVKPDNAEALLREAEIDGALVGGASLEVDSFLRIAGAVR